MKQSTLQQHKKVTMLCEKGMTIAKAKNALSIPQNIKHVVLTKTRSNIGRLTNIAQIVG
jgi:rRNA processing protein Gar1